MENNISNSTTTTSTIADFSVPRKTIDEAPRVGKEYYYDNPEWTQNLGYFKTIPEYKESTRSLARWSFGRGFTTDTRTQIILEHITGSGEDTFQSIITNHEIVKRVNGDSYTEIIRDDESGELINLKPLNPGSMRTVFNSKGMIIGYDEMTPDGKEAKHRFKPEEIFHSMNDRIANEVHGTSSLSACKWVIDAKNEAMADWRRIEHRSTIRVLYVDVDDTVKLSTLKTQYAEAIKMGEVLLLPCKKGDAELMDITVPPIDSFLQWIRYLEGFFYQAGGVPKAISNPEGLTEAGGKIGFLDFEPVYVEEQTLMEQDLWNQLGIRVKFNRPPSLSGTMQSDEAANTGQTSIQPSDTMINAGRQG